MAEWIAGHVLVLVVLRGAAGFAVVGALVAAGFHLAWAAGSRRGIADALPQDPGTGAPVRLPGRAATLAVALALITLAAIVLAEAAGTTVPVVRWAAVAAVVVLTARALGDGRWVGLFKSVRGTAFARADDRYWTPTVAVLALGTLASVVLGA